MFVVLKHILLVCSCDLQSGSGYCWWEGGCSAKYFFLFCWLFFFYGIFSLLKAPAESDESVPNEGDEGKATEEQCLGEVSVAL